MEKIALITDSAADLPKEIINKYNINVLPFRIIYSNGEYKDGVDITPYEVYSSLEKEIPSTSLPSMEEMENLFSTLEKEGYTHAICIHISSTLSGTANSIRLVAENHPNITSYIYDTKTLTGAQGDIVIETAKSIENGSSYENIINMLPELRKKVHCFFTIDTLLYLKKGGRIGRVAGTIGELLNLKPIIEVADDGIYNTYAKARGRKQAIKKLHKILDNFLSKGKCNIAVLHGHAKEDCIDFYNSIKDNPNILDIRTGEISPSLGINTGAGLIGLIIQEV